MIGNDYSYGLVDGNDRGENDRVSELCGEGISADSRDNDDIEIERTVEKGWLMSD